MSKSIFSKRSATVAAALMVATVGHAAFWSWRVAPTSVAADIRRIDSVSYSPSGRVYDPQSAPVTTAEIDKDMSAIAQFAGGIRTYSSLGMQGQAPAVAAKHGLNITLGIWISDDKARNVEEMQRGIALARSTRGVTRVVVGNEALLRGEVTDAELAEYVRQVRASVPRGIKVGTADVWAEIVKAKETARVSDYLGVHVLPYWEGVPADRAVAWIMSRLKSVRQAHPGKPLFVGEVGWPSGGDNFHQAYPSVKAQAALIRNFVAEAKAQRLSFNVIEAFDGLWKTKIEGSPGPHWGILDADRAMKWPLAGPVPASFGEKVGGVAAVVLGLLISVFAVARRRSNLGYAVAASVCAHVVGLSAGLALSGAFGEYLTFGAISAWGSAFALGAVMLAIAFADVADVARRFFLGRASALLPRSSSSSSPLLLTHEAAREPMVSIHVAACREQPEVLGAALQSLSRLNYKNFEVVVLINNTEDEALARPVEELCAALGPKFKFHWYRKISGFKAGALNAALRHTAPEAEIIAVLDADYTVSPEWLSRLVPAFSDPQVGIAQAPQEHRDGSESLLKAAMSAEYRPFFDIGMQEGLVSQAFICHGTMIMLRRSAMEAVGGWSEEGICEDTELGLRILSAGWRAAYTDERLGEGLAPDNFMQFRKQRDRWVFGSTQIFRTHWRKFLPTSKALTLRQKFGYLSNWARWWSDALGLVAAIAAVLWTIGMLLLPLHLPPVEATSGVLTALGLRVAASFAASRWISKNSWKDAVMGCVAGMAMSTTVALAALRGVVRKRDVFRVTSKGGRRASGRFCARPEALLSGALLAAAAITVQSNPLGTLSLQLWAALLATMALPNLAAVGFAIADVIPARSKTAQIAQVAQGTQTVQAAA